MSEPAKVLIDKDGFKWFLQDDGQYEGDGGYLHYSCDFLEAIFGPLTELKEEEEEEEEDMSDGNMPEVLIDCAGDRWELQDDGYYSYGWGTLYLDIEDLQRLHGPLVEPGKGVFKMPEQGMSEDEPSKVLIDDEGDEWYYNEDSGKYHFDDINSNFTHSLEYLKTIYDDLHEPDKGVFKKPEQKQEEEEVPAEALLNKDGLPKVVIDREGDAWTLWETDGKYHSFGEEFPEGLTLEPHVLEQDYSPLRLPGKTVFKMPEKAPQATEPPYPGTIIEVDGEKYIRSDHETYPWIDLEAGVSKDWAHLVRQGNVVIEAKKPS